MDTDVVIVGAGPTGLLLACELRLAGVRPIVLERRPEPSDAPKANGLGGQIVRLLDHRGLLAPVREGSPYAGPVPTYPFAHIPLELSRLGDDLPLDVVLIQQPRLERVLADRAAALDTEIRRGHRMTALSQDGEAVTLTVDGPDGTYRLRARYAVGCDGANSPVRRLGGIGFPGTTDPGVVLLGHFRATEATGDLYEAPDIEVPGHGRLQSGWNRTPRGRVIVTSLHPGVHMAAVRENDPPPGAYDDDAPVTFADVQAAMTRVLGGPVPLGEPIWLSRTTTQARMAEPFVAGRVLLAGDAAHLFPAGGAALNAGMTDALNLGWKLAATLRGGAPEGLLASYATERGHAAERTLLQTRAQAELERLEEVADAAIPRLLAELLTYEHPLRHVAELMSGADARYAMTGADPHPLAGRVVPDLRLTLPAEGERGVAELMRAARPVLLDLAGDAELRQAAGPWRDRVDLVTAGCARPPARAVLIRPDGYVAWAGDTPDGLPEALAAWFGTTGEMVTATPGPPARPAR
ncbi:FAD-dependent oxidoreductase [Spongiactinospora rosea]|uniref:FAD-dependent oxidoreductase n=1 Tax=Spongiactinospora rosea TaxID=2248750 RepID=A0A366LUS7_9ACTN|nr:FAD-dependent monooxygenase [Spongiactinospora rosea]RBQ17303.1 FAD-dependent oxidoreductase [Spongiactinospora rosea]